MTTEQSIVHTNTCEQFFTFDVMQHSHTSTHVRAPYTIEPNEPLRFRATGSWLTLETLMVEREVEYYGKLECVQAILIGRAGVGLR